MCTAFEPHDDALLARDRLARYARVRFRHEQGGHDADADESGHRRVARVPSRVGRYGERTGAACDERYPIADLVGRQQRPLRLHGAGFDAPCIQSDVLRSCTKSDKQRAKGHVSHPGGRIAQAEFEQSRGETDLRQQHPAAPAAQETVEERRRHAIDHGRPEELDRVENADPREHPDRRALHSHLP